MASKYEAARSKWTTTVGTDLLPSGGELPPIPNRDDVAAGIAEAPGAFVRGAVRSPAAVLGLSEFMRGRQDPNAAVNSQVMDQILSNRSGIAEPQSLIGRGAQRMGQSAPLMAASWPAIGAIGAESALAGSAVPFENMTTGQVLSTALGGAGRSMGQEIIGDVIASMTEQGAQDAGAGGGGQFLAGLAGGLVSPTSVADDAAQAGNSAARRSAAKAIADEWGIRPGFRSVMSGPYRHPFSKEVTDAATQRAEAEAKRLNVNPGAMRRASSEVKRRMSLDPYGEEQFIKAGSDRIDEARGLFPDPNNRPLTDQILSDEAGVVGMASALSKVDDEARQAAGGRRKVLRNDLAQQWENIYPEGSAAGVNASATATFDKMKADERTLWAAIPRDKMPRLDLRGVRTEIKAIRKNASNRSGKYIPDEFNTLEEMWFDAPFDAVQASYSELAKLMREADKSPPGSDIRQVAVRVKPVVDALKKQLDAIPENAGGLEFQTARNFTRAKNALFNPDSPAYDAVMNLGTTTKQANRILSAEKPVEAAQQAVDILGRSERGRDQLARVFVDRLFDESLGERTPRAILTDMRRNGDVYRTVLGKDRYKLYETLIRKAEMSRRNKTGDVSAVHSTASGVGPVDILFGGADAVREPVAGIRKVAQTIQKYAKSDKQKNAILREALYDSDLWQTLLQMPEPRAVAAWAKEWDVLVARSRAREAARSAVRSGNAEREQLRVNQPLPGQGMGGGVR